MLSEKRLKQIMKEHGLGTITCAKRSCSSENDQETANSPVPLLSEFSPPRTSPRPHPNGWSVMEEASFEKVKPIAEFVLGHRMGRFDWKKLGLQQKGYELDTQYMKPGARLSDMLLHQLDYMHNSDHLYRLYGRGGHDWGVTFNADMGIMFTVLQRRVIEEHEAGALFVMYQRLLAAARQVDVSASDLRSQLYVEYGIDPLLAALPPPSTPREAAARHTHEESARASYRAQKIELLKALRQQESDDYAPFNLKSRIEVDKFGIPVYREEVHGMDAVFCVPVNKTGDGWRMTS
ncbi:hypothetical protein SCP_0801900 [Sparassis crispa]|uniref:Uncharacterized protein n=1 Tax=Sparassis crispa TaxID=139825 RepID=A0A401GU11_9APHY|nr:hypothetical protein SCP_0801900 [Sparassis crispa]GBE85669.1 hypothetical protein SCP_0801900 [Sparassis crispa]